MIIYEKDSNKGAQWVFLNSDNFGIVLILFVDGFAMKWKSPYGLV
jgi:hypothetical protein